MRFTAGLFLFAVIVVAEHPVMQRRRISILEKNGIAFDVA
ncbi:hypothetical protein BDSB_28130 [Burkholderia dolosa PC543]|nr:hypothetical protein BDSB_28130 [Burkholderia dolosa PC543]